MLQDQKKMYEEKMEEYEALQLQKKVYGQSSLSLSSSLSSSSSSLLTCARTAVVQDGTYRVILSDIMKAGCHPVAIAQVVEH